MPIAGFRHTGLRFAGSFQVEIEKKVCSVFINERQFNHCLSDAHVLLLFFFVILLSSILLEKLWLPEIFNPVVHSHEWLDDLFCSFSDEKKNKIRIARQASLGCARLYSVNAIIVHLVPSLTLFSAARLQWMPSYCLQLLWNLGRTNIRLLKMKILVLRVYCLTGLRTVHIVHSFDLPSFLSTCVSFPSLFYYFQLLLLFDLKTLLSTLH